ncbi:Selenocysteine-specific translation elongation factor [Rubrivivax sp. A210]|uniref:selenocysteine-specific translation elongation factor n=1 Tax=Rubrivivax sp. A210 TaxID=2772301 RepID=UPI0019185C54|nr:selenocysteine-specific translation elongation factor [Rubrivivax sp. A210]CAD5373804.1 Selenocysteine-specific translation elongation factor [Rubrivivax sp. A210]
MIVGTAGHIDHGKTSLVKSLTGFDADRLKEEKARGITIDLGFAYKPLPDGGMMGFVDVPGHERLVRNMLAGATGIDHVLLVVAADDGPMPQTREHLAILDLLGLDRGAVVLTKCDLVSPARLAEVSTEIEELLQPTALAGAAIFPVSNFSGAGLAALEQHLLQARLCQASRADDDLFRLAVDRCFSLAGIGTVVTGTAVSGRVAVGDRVLVSPRKLAVRVRGLHAQNREAQQGVAGQRLALNLAATGLEKSDISRGDWIVADAAQVATRRIDARLRLLPGEPRELAHWTPVHLHLGACDVGARVVLLESTALAPGADALVQLELDRDIAAWHGDRFILRDQSATRTLGGGSVIDPFATATNRRKPQRLAALAALEQADPAAALADLLALQPAAGVEQEAYTVARKLQPAARTGLLQAVPHRALADGPVTRLFAAGQLESLSTGLTEALATHHRKQPDSPGLTPEVLQRQSTSKPRAWVFSQLLRELIATGRVQRAGPYLRLAGQDVALLANEQKLWERLRPWLDEGGLHAPKLSDMLARDRSLHRDQVLRLLRKLAQFGKLYAVSDEYFIQPRHLHALALESQRLAAAEPHRRLNVKDLRESLGLSRHLSLPLVEFFDQVGFTKRDPEGRRVRRDATEMFGGASQA